MKENLIIGYFVAAGLSGFFTWCSDDEFENFWDWLIYNLLWVKQPLKYFLKHLTKF